MTPFICVNTIVQTPNKSGLVISVDREKKIAVVRSKDGFFTEKFENLSVVSYKEVK